MALTLPSAIPSPLPPAKSAPDSAAATDASSTSLMAAGSGSFASSSSSSLPPVPEMSGSDAAATATDLTAPPSHSHPRLTPLSSRHIYCTMRVDRHGIIVDADATASQMFGFRSVNLRPFFFTIPFVVLLFPFARFSVSGCDVVLPLTSSFSFSCVHSVDELLHHSVSTILPHLGCHSPPSPSPYGNNEPAAVYSFSGRSHKGSFTFLLRLICFLIAQSFVATFRLGFPFSSIMHRATFSDSSCTTSRLVSVSCSTECGRCIRWYRGDRPFLLQSAGGRRS